MQYDYIVVGAGSAGSVLAHRLSALPDCRVLVLEAGPDMPHGRIPEALLDSYPGAAYINPAHTWSGLKVTTDAASATPRLRPYEQARVMGGGSSINGQLANRGSPLDYDEWAARGAAGWSWQDVLPWFRELERDMDFGGLGDALHGNEGRLPIRRIFPDLWPGHARALARALEASGLPYLPDQNGAFDDGYYPTTMNNAYERRVSSSTAYLDPVTRQRPNLHIRTGTEVSRLLFEGTRCVGVEALADGVPTRFHAGEVVLSGGAIHSPAILLRSGVGPADAARGLGIGVVADVPGVGQGLMDHPMIALASFLAPEARVNGFTRRHIVMGWRYTSGVADAPGDMNCFAATRTAWHDVGAQIGSLLLIVNKTFSQSGEVALQSADWRVPPRVDFRLLSDERDMQRLMDGFRRLASLHEHADMRAVTSQPFPAVWGEKVRQVGAMTARNRAYTALAARLLDGPAPLRRWLMRKYVIGKYDLKAVMDDPALLRAFIREAVIGGWHASSSCRMGAATDAMAVTAPDGRVHGVQGLRVADASIFPTVPRANLNLPVIMAAEKLADAMAGTPA